VLEFIFYVVVRNAIIMLYLANF